jgi:hypothetical protein
MRPASLAILTFVVSLVSYASTGYLWFLSDSYFGLGAGTSSFATRATEVQIVGFAAFVGAVGTAFAVYAIERHYSIPKSHA